MYWNYFFPVSSYIYGCILLKAGKSSMKINSKKKRERESIDQLSRVDSGFVGPEACRIWRLFLINVIQTYEFKVKCDSDYYTG